MCCVRYAIVVMAMSLTAFSRDIFQIVETRDLCALSSVTGDIRQVNSVNRSGDTPLMLSARIGDVAMVKMLLEAGADVGVSNKGFTVKEQLESYLRRTGDSRKEIEFVLKEIGIKRQLIESFRKESDALGDSPSQRRNWNAILGLIRNYESNTVCRVGASKAKSYSTCKVSRSFVKRDKLKVNDLERVFSNITAVSNAVYLIVREGRACYFALHNYRSASNLKGGEVVCIPAGDSLKLVGNNTRIVFTGTKNILNDKSLLWQFDVEYNYVNRNDNGDEIMSLRGILSARKGYLGNMEIIIE